MLNLKTWLERRRLKRNLQRELNRIQKELCVSYAYMARGRVEMLEIVRDDLSRRLDLLKTQDTP
jgi:hypothetical protein